MAIVISGVNNNDKITAADGKIDLLSGVSYASTITAPDFTASNNITAASINVGSNIQLGNAGIVTATTFIGNLTGNVNNTGNLLLQISGSEKFRVGSSGQLGIGGANYGTSGQVLTSGGSGSAATWSTVTGTTINNNADNRLITGSGSANTLEGEANLTWNGQTFEAYNASGPSYIAAKSNTNSGDYGIVQVQSGSTVRGRLVSDASVDAFRLDTAGRASAPITFHTGSSYAERVRITSAGLVGVGQATPTHMLHVDSSNASDSTATAFFKGRIIRFDGAASAHSPRLNFSLDGTDKAQILLHRTNIGLDIATLAAEPIKFKINSVEKLRISSQGYVTKPSTPAFFASHSGASNSQTGYLTFNSGTNGYYNNGNHFDLSTGAFHAPVTGIYFFHFHGFLQSGVSTGNFEYTIRRANSDGSGVVSLCRQYGYRDHSGEYGPNVSMMVTAPMTAGQTMRVHISTKPLHGSNGYYFGGYLIG